MLELKLIQIDDSVAVILPKDLLAKLKVTTGDMLYATELPNGVMLTPSEASRPICS